jgi:hypothetical protein
MKLRGISSKSAAVRLAVEEAAMREAAIPRAEAFAQLRGAARRAPLNTAPRFRDEDDLWS